VFLAVVGIIYASIIAIQQTDFKRLIAYSSIAHVGVIAAGVFAANAEGLQGGLIQMLNHGINIVGLFFIGHIIEQRLNTRNLANMGGIAQNAPKFAAMFMIILLGSVAIPLTNGFVGEFLLLNGLYIYKPLAALFAGLTIILCAVYMLRVYQLAMFGHSNAATANFEDVKNREFWVLSGICFLVLLLGVYPQPILNLTESSVQKILLLAK
jgi:NADH-quinone oxidoreductase subunit M